MYKNYDSNSYIKVKTKLVPNRVLKRRTDGNCILLLNILVPVKLTNVSGDLTVPEGSNAKLFCEATGRPQPNIILSRELEDGSIEVLQQGITIARDFLNIRRNASGAYRCTAENGYTNDSKVFKVNVTCKYISLPYVSLLFIRVRY